MEPEVLLSYSQEPPTGPYPEPDASVHSLPSYFPQIHSNIIFLTLAWNKGPIQKHFSVLQIFNEK
jgi:hypothetical protein